MKNYGDWGGCYPAETDNTLLDLHNFSYDTTIILLFHYSFKIIPSLKTWLKHAYLHWSINVKFICDSARLGLFSSANILQIVDVTPRVVFLLFLPCFWQLFRLVLTLETSEMSAISVFTTKTTQPRPQVFSVNSALICKKASLLTSLLQKCKILPIWSLVNYAYAFSQSESGKYFEWIIIALIVTVKCLHPLNEASALPKYTDLRIVPPWFMAFCTGIVKSTVLYMMICSDWTK